MSVFRYPFLVLMAAVATACGSGAGPGDTASSADTMPDSAESDTLTSNDIGTLDGLDPGADVEATDSSVDDAASDIADGLTSTDIDEPADLSTADDTAIGPDTTSDGCPLGLACVRGFCVTGPDDGQCITNDDCPGISSCNPDPAGGVCLGCGGDGDCPGSAECTSSGACAEPCTTQNDCTHGRCATTIGYCVIRTCNDSVECGTGETCDGGQCRRLRCADPCNPNPCVAPGRTVCTSEGTDFTCTCDAGLEPDPDGPGCVAPPVEDCAAGFACRNELCVQTNASFFQCADNVDCGGTLTCSPALPSGTCQGCTTPTQCPAGYDTCLAGRCLRTCTGSADCHAGMVCTPQGYCGQKTCVADGDCAFGYVCSNTGDPRRCVRAACTP